MLLYETNEYLRFILFGVINYDGEWGKFLLLYYH